MKRIRTTFVFGLLLLAGLSCSVSSGGNETSPTTGAPPVSGEQVQSPTEAVTQAPVEIQGEPYISSPGIESIHLLTDIQGVGEKPLFSWEAVSGADRYQLVLFDENEEPYWAWEGGQTRIYMGGSEEQPPADSSGPSIAADYHWAVVAYDAGGQVLASSEVRPISP